MPLAMKPKFLSRAQRRKEFELDCADELVWKGWRVGGDYERKYTIKNVSKDIQRIQYKLPSTKFFYMEFPSVITLSPGMAWTVSVNFRPIRAEEYHDHVEFQVFPKASAAGKRVGTQASFLDVKNAKDVRFFYVPVRAMLPHLDLSMPSRLSFGFCPVGETSRQVVRVNNTGDVPVQFHWRCPPAFRFAPSRGLLPAGHSVAVEVFFHPTEAVVVRSFATLEVSGSSARQLELRGVAKFPYVSFEEDNIDFGRVVTGTKLSRSVKLVNRGEVWTTLTISRVKDSTPEVPFVVVPTSLTLKAGASADIVVHYHPTATEVVSLDRFAVHMPAQKAAVATLQCRGQAIGPHVTVDARVLHFGDVRRGSSATRSLTLTNSSKVPVFFTFVNYSSAGSFEIEPWAGTIPALLSVKVNVTFTPSHPINYYKRLFCLVENAHPIHCDLVGTAWDDDVRPAPLLLRHVDAYFRRLESGLQHLAPEHIAAALQAKPQLTTSLERSYSVQFFSALDQTVPRLSVAVNAFQQFFQLHQDPQREASIREPFVAFGSCSHRRVSPYKTVHVQNRTNGKVVCRWDWDDEADLANNSSSDNNKQVRGRRRRRSEYFVVLPASQDIPPGATAEFKVAFRPDRPNFYFFQLLECYIFYKTNRTFRLVDDETFTPPLCLGVPAYGHTFVAGAEHFLPEAELSTEEVVFPSRLPHHASFQTVKLRNIGDTPMTYVFPQPSSADGVFTVRPAEGLIKAHSFELLAFRFDPAKVGQFQHDFRCVVNHVNDVPLNVRVRGAAYVPQVEFHNVDDVTGQLFFKPTCQGTVCQRTMGVHNMTRIKTAFRFRIPDKYRSVIQVHPEFGVLGGNETVQCTWTFCPAEIRRYQVRASCSLTAITEEVDEDELKRDTASSSPSLTAMKSLTVVGECGSGVIQFDPPLVDCGPVRVGADHERSFLIHNRSDAALSYKLGWQQVKPPPKPLHNRSRSKVDLAQADAAAGGLHESAPLRFDLPTGDIPARAHVRVTATVCLPSVGQAEFRLGVDLSHVGDHAHDPDALDTAASTLSCTFKAQALLPQPRVTDVRMEHAPLSAAWEQLSVDLINKELASALTPLEEQLNMERAIGDSSGTASSLSDDENSMSRSNGGQSTPSGGTQVANLNVMAVGELLDMLKHFPINFGLGQLGSSPLVAYMQLQNTGPLDVEFELKWPRELEVSMEKWADKGFPSAAEKRRQAVQDFNLFSITPSSGTLKQGETVCVRMTYTSKFVGQYELPVMFKIKHSKSFVLLLQGETVDRLPPCFTILPHLQQFAFANTAVGLAADEVPLQTYPLINDTPWPLQYELDVEPLRAMAQENYDFVVMDCVNARGVVPAESTGVLRFRFHPLEAKLYATNLILHMWTAKSSHQGDADDDNNNNNSEYDKEDIDSPQDDSYQNFRLRSQITFSGLGVMPQPVTKELRALEKAQRGNVEYPAVQSLLKPGQLAQLSADFVDFGDAPLHATEHCVVVLTNLDKERAVSYRCVGLPTARTARDPQETVSVRVYPSSGTVGPGQSTLLKVQMHTGAQALVMDRDIALQVAATSPPKDRGGNSSRRSPGRRTKRNNNTTNPLGQSLVLSGGTLRPPPAVSPPRISVVDKRPKRFQQYVDVSASLPLPPSGDATSSTRRPVFGQSSDVTTLMEPVDPMPQLEQRAVDVLYLRLKAHVMPAAQLAAKLHLAEAHSQEQQQEVKGDSNAGDKDVSAQQRRVAVAERMATHFAIDMSDNDANAAALASLPADQAAVVGTVLDQLLDECLQSDAVAAALSQLPTERMVSAAATTVTKSVFHRVPATYDSFATSPAGVADAATQAPLLGQLADKVLEQSVFSVLGTLLQES